MILFYGKGRVSDGVCRLAESLRIPVDVRDDADADIDFSQYDAVIPTPGVSPRNRAYTSDRILAEMDFASRYLPKGFKTVCVTGTDGKSTTAWILYQLLCAEYGEDSVFLSGNFEIPFSETVRQIRERGLRRWYIVIEVSSFMAYNLSRPSGLGALESLPKGERTGGFRPDYSIFTNFETDHLNWHADLQDYFASKMRVFELTERLSVINAQVFAKVEEMGLKVGGLENVRVFWEIKDRGRAVFASGAKQSRSNQPFWKSEDPETSSGWQNINLALCDRIEYPRIIISGREKYSMAETQFSGAHNAMNILSVALVTGAMKICSKRTREYLKNISGLSHRLEFVTEKKWIRFVDDSKSTSAQSLIAALGSFRPITQDSSPQSPHPDPPPEGEGTEESASPPLHQGEEKISRDGYWQVGESERFSPWEGGVRGGAILLIAWGSDKWDEFIGAGEAMHGTVRHAELIGATREKLAEICEKNGIEYHLADSMDEAVRANYLLARPGDTVLLSPGCASFGMFRDYLDRAEKFREAVNSL